MTPTPADKAALEAIQRAIRAKRERDKAQPELLSKESLWHETIRGKLHGLFDTNQFRNFEKCGHETIYKTCRGCHDVTSFEYRCSIKWCPRCNWVIANRRRDVMRAWAKRITQGKHLVLTQRNSSTLTASMLRKHQRALAKVRRQKFFEGLRGGAISIEITNEGAGWHLHSHWLVDCDWIDMQRASVAWGQLVGQDFAIVKVKDAREADYVREVSKYVVKGNEMAVWPAEQIHEFVRAIRGRRFFFTFGSLFKLQRQLKAEIEAAKPHAKPCDCGCSKFVYETDEQSVCRAHRQ